MMNVMEKKRKKIGIMGGTFDPIHMGHLILGEKTCEQLQLDKVLFLPSGNPPHKRNRTGRASDSQRVEMVRRGISSNPSFQLSLMEMEKDGYSYTYRTLEQLTQENPDTDYYFIIGGDSLMDFECWKKPERICKCCTIVVATRNSLSPEKLEERMNYLAKKYQGKFIPLDTLNIEISSQEIRNWIHDGKSVRYYVPDEVRNYIEEQHIYKGMME